MPQRFRFPLFLLSVSVILIVAPLIQKGLFIDGLLYKTVSYNYFQGESSFWKMKFTDVSMNPFYEQPPLYFFITGAFYKVFGSSLIADRILTIIFLALSCLLVRKCCKILFEGERIFFQATILFLLSVQVLCWSYVNQMIETLVLLFSLVCAFLFLKSLNANNKKLIFYISGFALMIPILFFTKGFQSCFIIVLPFFHCLLFKSKKSLVFALASSVISAIILYLLLFQYPPSAEWFSHYSQKRLLASLNNVGATTDNHFDIIFRVFAELLFPIVLVLILFLTIRAVKINNDKIVWVLLLTAVAGSFPFAVTLEQRGFYLVPSFPFYVMGIVMLFSNHISLLFEKINKLLAKQVSLYIVSVIFAASVAYLIVSAGLYKRDENLIKDLSVIEAKIPQGDTVSILQETWNNVPLHGYLYMHLKSNLDADKKHTLLIHDRTISEKPDSSYQKIVLKTLQYDLYKKENLVKQ